MSSTPNRQPEESQSPEELVLQTIRDIVFSGELLSSSTNEPLSKREKAEYMSRATFYFIKQEQNWMCQRPDGCDTLAPAYDVILRLLKMEDWLSETLKCIVETICQTPTRDESEYQTFLEQLRRDLLPQDSEPLPNGVHELNLNQQQLIRKVWGHVQDNVWGYVTAASSSTFGKAVIASAVDEIALAFEGTIRPYNIASGVRCTAMVSGLYLFGTIGYNVYEAGRGRKSWKRVAKNAIEEIASVAAGAFAGIGISVLLAPFTGGISLICGAFAGIAANIATRTLVKKYTGRLLNIPEDEVLERAYATLETNQLIENVGISRAYREKSRQYHPDKTSGRYPNATEDERNKYLLRYLKVQAAFGMIVAARKNDVDKYENARKHFEKIEESELLEKNCIDLYLKLWAVNQVRTLWSYFVQTKNNLKFPAIINGYLPYEFFEDSEMEEAVAA